MTRARAKANRVLTTASAPPIAPTPAQTVDVANNANVLRAWVSGMRSVRTPLRTYGHRLAASATPLGATAETPLASTSTQTPDDSPTPLGTLSSASAFQTGSSERLPFLHTKLIHRMRGRT